MRTSTRYLSREVIELRSRIEEANNALIELQMDNNAFAAQQRASKGRIVIIHELGTVTLPILEMGLHSSLLSLKGTVVLSDRADIDSSSRVMVFGSDGKMIHSQPYSGLEIHLKRGDTLTFTYDLKFSPVIDR